MKEIRKELKQIKIQVRLGIEQKEIKQQYGILLLDSIEKAINYTRCSTQLKDRHKINFDSWLNDNCESIGSGLYLYKNRKCSYDALKIDYRHELEQSL